VAVLNNPEIIADILKEIKRKGLLKNEKDSRKYDSRK